MLEQKPKLGKIGALKEVTKKLTELRKKPLSKKVFDIVQENYDRPQPNQGNKKIAKPKNDKKSDLEA